MCLHFELRVARESAQGGEFQQEGTGTCRACGLVVIGIAHAVAKVDLWGRERDAVLFLPIVMSG